MARLRTVTVLLGECRTTLYRADAAGNPILEEAVWVGAKTEGMSLGGRILMVTSTPSGAEYEEEEQLGEGWTLEMERIWAINPGGVGAGRDFELKRGKYVLVVYWESQRHRYWQKRTYYWVTAQEVGMRSVGESQTHFGQNQKFGARFYTSESGRLAEGAAGNPTTPGSGDGTGTSDSGEQALLFTHLGVMKVGGYFLGQYQFTGAVEVTRAKVYAKASQTTATVVGLEKNGVMTSLTLSLGTGAAGSEVSAGGVVSPVLSIEAGALLRVKVVSGPAGVEEMGYGAGWSMNVKG